MSASFGPAPRQGMTRLALPIGQAMICDGRRMTLHGRARDQGRRLVFVDDDGLPRDFDDSELLILQAEGQLSFLSPGEAAPVPHPKDRPAILLDSEPDAAKAKALQAAALRRRAYVHAWEAAGMPPRTETAIRPLIEMTAEQRCEARPGARTVLRWIAKVIAHEGMLDACVPQTARRGNFTDRLAPAARDLLSKTVEENYLVATRPTIEAIYQHVIDAFGEYNRPLLPSERLQVPSRTTVYAEVDKIDLYTQEYTRFGKRRAGQRFRPVGTAPMAHAINDVWEIDHTQINCFVRINRQGQTVGRPYLTIIIDRFSRMIVGLWISFDPPSIIAVFECLKIAMAPKQSLLDRYGVIGIWFAYGKPRCIVTDHGAEFKSTSFRLSLDRLGIEVEYTPVLKPWFKGKIERVIKTILRQVFERIPGTTFADIFERSKETPPETVAVCTLDELWHHTLDWVVNFYNPKPHRTLLASPNATWQAQAALGLRPPPNPDMLRRCLSVTIWCSPQRQGLQYLYLLYNAPALAALRIRTDAPRVVKFIVDHTDMSRAWFIDPTDNQEKPLQAVGPHAHLLKGRSLDGHRLALALMNAQPDKYAGAERLAMAYTALDKAMQARTGASGTANRREAGASWKQVNRVLSSRDPKVQEELKASGNISDQIFVEDETPFAAEAPAIAVSKPTARRAASARGRGTAHRQAPLPPVIPDEVSTEAWTVDEDDFDPDAYAQRHGLTGGQA